MTNTPEQGESEWRIELGKIFDDTPGPQRAFAVAVFVEKLLSHQKEELVEAVKKLKYQTPLLGTPETTERVMLAVNSALDDVLKIIQSQE